MLVLECVILQVGAEEALVDKEELEENSDDVEVWWCEEVVGIDVLVLKVVVLPVGAEVALIDREELEEHSDDVEVWGLIWCEEVGGIDVLVPKVVLLLVGAEEALIDREELEECSDDFEVWGLVLHWGEEVDGEEDLVAGEELEDVGGIVDVLVLKVVVLKVDGEEFDR